MLTIYLAVERKDSHAVEHLSELFLECTAENEFTNSPRRGCRVLCLSAYFDV